MNERNEERNERAEDTARPNIDEKEQSLKPDQEDTAKEPREGSEPISDAGKRREGGERYQ